MKLNEIESSAKVPVLEEEQFFSIQDQGMIFDILRNKMYSNPIAAICREISCNARDAHREVGKFDVPIHIYLPTASDPYFKVKDFGPGISPERISNIFIKYTASTKRSDNVQTGGFGLGAKTPFSYSDSFTIVTNVNGKKYNYNCFIDETKVGKIVLLSESDTKDDNGTEIIIPVEFKDFRSFAEETEFCTRHWDVKPIVKGAAINWKPQSCIIAGNKWKAVSNGSWQRSIKLIIDGIEYPLDDFNFLNSLRQANPKAKIIDSWQSDVYLYFNVGELSLSANREKIYLDKPTQQKVKEAFDNMLSGIKESVEKEIFNSINYRDANAVFRKFAKSFGDINILGNFFWRELPLTMSSHINVDCQVYTFSKNTYHDGHARISRSIGRSLHFNENSELYINDLDIKDVVTKHVKLAFDNNPSLKSVQVITPSREVTLKVLDDKYYLYSWLPKNISSITKYNARKNSSTANRLIVYKFENNEFTQIKFDAIEFDDKKKILCFFDKNSFNGKRSIYVDSKEIQCHILQDIVKDNPDYSFYAVDSSTPAVRIAEDLEDFQTFLDFMNEKVLSRTREEYISIYYRREYVYFNIDRDFINNYAAHQDKIVNKDSVFLQKLEQEIRFANYPLSLISELQLYEKVNGHITAEEISKYVEDHPEDDRKIIDSLYQKTYPLINFVPKYKEQFHTTDIIDYVNFIDSKKD